MDASMIKTPVGAIKFFFEQNNGRKVTMEEMTKLNSDDRSELGMLAAKALGIEFEKLETMH